MTITGGQRAHRAGSDVAVITGSGGVGCGHAIAQCFARAGYVVVVSEHQRRARARDAGAHKSARTSRLLPACRRPGRVRPRSGRYGSAAYDIAKAGLLRFTTALAPFAEARGVRINAFAPGWIGVPELMKYYDSLTPEQRIENGVPSRLLALDQVCDAVYQLATDATLNGRIMQWWSEDPRPSLIAWRDRGYKRSEPLDG